MKDITITVYKFNELSEDIQDKVIERQSDINVDYDWWEFVYEDAEQIGLKITEFDTDRYCKGNFIDSAKETAHKIIDNHGENCETYKTASEYLKDRDNLIDTFPKDKDEEIDEYKLDNDLDDLDSEFLRSLLEDYRIILRNEYEYLTSRESIIETIEINDYDFTIDGKIA